MATSRPSDRGLPSPPVETLRISQRLVLHIYRQGALGPHEVAPLELCQLGMTQTLGVRQTALTKVLTRLVAAGVLDEERRHVRGQPRRLKTYQLTPLGESLARDLRRHALPATNRPRIYVDPTSARRARD